jgi:hypothetical protein
MHKPEKTYVVLCEPVFKIVDEHELFESFGVSDVNFLNLAGGIPVVDNFPLECKIIIHSLGIAEVHINSSIYRCERQFDFENKVIANVFLRVNAAGNGTGKRLLMNQITEARSFAFKKINLYASGGEEMGGNTEWNGYYTWGRFGFEMILEDQAKFNLWRKKFNRDEESLYDLLLTQEGRALWLEEGFSWHGEFDLDEKSITSKRFERYQAKSY